MLAPLLGLNIPFRQSFSAILMSFTVAAAILGAFSPLMAFMIWNAPPMSSADGIGAPPTTSSSSRKSRSSRSPGSTGNVRLFQLLARLGSSRAVARRVLFAWLVGNLFLGSQLSWILRPFIGSPSLPVEFFRATALHGNFYENVFHSLLQILQQFD